MHRLRGGRQLRLGQAVPAGASIFPDSVCQACGACCATYRITLPRVELDNAPEGWVPAALTEPYTATTACMRECTDIPGRCIALQGTIGVAVSCAIYPQRPSACSEFAPLSALGCGDEACDEARRRHGLPSLGGL
ncbi:MAG: YkgJ family cysteine cluster protein [Rhodocyclaceae bacterium]|nr:YkgJ family cysteine cluster protein [Rhodocyclaceae bacterium]